MTIFRDDADRRAYLDLLGWVVREWQWDCVDYCLMGTHMHLVIRTRRANLGYGMQRLHWFYAVDFNARYGRVGHLFERRYGSSRLWDSDRFAAARSYVALNPVEAKLSSTPEEWPWSSAAARAAGDRPQWLASRHTVADIEAGLRYGSFRAAA